VGPERVRIQYRAVWVQIGTELNTGLNVSREVQNSTQGSVGPEKARIEYRAEGLQRG